MFKNESACGQPKLFDASKVSELYGAAPTVEDVLKDVKTGLLAALHAMALFKLYDRAVEAQIRGEIQRIDYAIEIATDVEDRPVNHIAQT